MSTTSSSTDTKNDVAVTVHLPEKTTKKTLLRLRKMDKEELDKKLESTLKRANTLTVKLVRARKELQDLETTKYHWAHPDEDLFPNERKRRPSTRKNNNSDDADKPLKKKAKKAKNTSDADAQTVEVKEEDA